VKAGDLVELAARNLRESVLRNSLTTLGIGVGVASLVAMLSLGIGLQQLANRRLARSGLFDAIMVNSRRGPGGFNRRPFANGPPAADSRPLDENARLEIARLPNVREAAPDIRFATELHYQDKAQFAMVAGLPPSARENDAFENIQGKFFSSDTADEAILQIQFANDLLGIHPDSENPSPKVSANTQALIGKEITLSYAERIPSTPGSETNAGAEKTPGPTKASTDALNDAGESAVASFSVVPRERKLRVVGITDQEPEGMRGAAGARVFLPLQLVENLHIMLPSGMSERNPNLSSVPAYSSINVRVRGPNDVESVEDAIKKLGYNAYSILDATRNLRRFFAVLDLFLGIFGSLALTVAALGIVNTLVMAILERRREIGIMKALGASDWDVGTLFFVEAAVMGLVGGIIGVALGWSIGRVINIGTNIYLQRQELPAETLWAVPWWLVVGAIVFSVLASMISGIYPAARAARLDPVQALRYE
jgi:putative ABC transport system permease protein